MKQIALFQPTKQSVDFLIAFMVIGLEQLQQASSDSLSPRVTGK